MRFFVSIPGQPVSLDAAYRTGKVQITDRKGEQREIHRPILTDEAKRWRDDVQLLVQTAKPSKWKPAGQIRVVLDLYLAHPMDADNTLKLILDGIQRALDYDDANFLPSIRSMRAGYQLKNAHVDIEINEEEL